MVLDPVTRQAILPVESDVPSGATHLAWSPDSRQMAIGFKNGEIRVFEFANGKLQPALAPRAGKSPVRTLGFSADNKSLLAVFERGDVARVYRRSSFIDPNTGEERFTGWNSISIGYKEGRETITVGDISADGRRVVTGTESGKITIWNTETTNKEADPATADLSLSQVDQRELLELNELHKSPVSFVKFFKNRNNDNQIDIVSAELGGTNQLVIWKSNGK